MRIADLTLEKFLMAVAGVNAALSDPEYCDQFLGAASSDTPIIEALLGLIAVIEGSSEDRDKSSRLVEARQNLIVLLALRNIEKTKGITADPIF